jgi:hypothetical protein
MDSRLTQTRDALAGRSLDALAEAVRRSTS